MRLGRRAFVAILALLAVVAGLMVLGILVPRGPDRAYFAGAAERHAVYLAASPIHTDIVLPATPDLLARFAFLQRDGLPLDHPALGTIVVGWGGRAFYTQTPTWADLSFDAVWRSFTRDRSVLHLGLAGPVAERPDIRRLDLGDAAYAALLDFIEASFAGASDGSPQVLPDVAYGAFDRFYEAQGSFNVVLGCNTWTAAALRAAGLSTGFWTPLPANLFWALDLHGSP